MGMMKFDLPADLPADIRSALGACWLAGGYDGAPVPVRRKLEANQLTLSRDENDSGHLQMTWPGIGGETVATSSTLRLREEPYRLMTELARGSVNRIRNLVADLRSGGIPFSPELVSDLATQTQAFGRIVLDTESPVCAARDVIDACTVLANQGVDAYSQYRLETRAKAHGQLPTWYGCRVSKPLTPDEAEAYASTFTAIRIVPNWSVLEPKEANFQWDTLDPLVQWANEAGLGVSIGPLIDLGSDNFPDWLKAWNGDIPSLTAFMSDFIGTVVGRYRDQVRVWQLFTGFNHADSCGLGEDDRVRLAARLLDTAKEVDPEGVWIIGVTQPWGDYLTDGKQVYSPLVFADTLIRAGYQIGGIELEMLRSTTAGRGSHHRDLLDVIQVMDLFDHLSVPLEITLGGKLAGSALPPGIATVVSAPSAQAVYWDAWSANDPCNRVPEGHLWTGSAETDAMTAFRLFRQRWLR